MSNNMFKFDNVLLLKACQIETKLGSMIAIADEQELYLLEFADWKGVNPVVTRLQRQVNAAVTPGRTQVIDSIEKELHEYFNGQLKEFSTPYKLVGTFFEKSVWHALANIPYGQTRSYAQVAVALGNPRGFRAVARANSVNKLAVLIPCHRVINANGQLGGYASGLERKQWLLNKEKMCV